MDKAKSLTKNNKMVKTNQKQGIQCRCGFIEHLRIASNNCPAGISYQKSKKLSSVMGISISKKDKAA